MKRRSVLKHLAGGISATFLSTRTRSQGPPLGPDDRQQSRIQRLLEGGHQGLPEAVQQLSTSPDARVREVSAFLLGEFGGPEHATVLLGSLDDPAERVRRAAMTAIQKILNPAVVHIEHGDTALLPPPATLPPELRKWCHALTKSLDDFSPLVRAPAAQTLAWLRCLDSVAHLEARIHDPIEPVRFAVSQALHSLTGRGPEFIHPQDFIRSSSPLASIGKSREFGSATQLSPFLRTAFFEPQGKFTFSGGIPARLNTIAHLRWEENGLLIGVWCEDPGSSGDERDEIKVQLQPDAKSDLYYASVTSLGTVKQWIIRARTLEQPADLGVHASVGRDRRGWHVELRVPFRGLGISTDPLGTTWNANICRTEVHHSPGFGNEVSSWSYSARDFYPSFHLGQIHFVDPPFLVAFRPEADNHYAFPLDQYSLPGELNRPLAVEATLGNRTVPPEHLQRTVNQFTASVTNPRGGTEQGTITLTAVDWIERTTVASHTQDLRLDGVGSIQPVTLAVPHGAASRALDLEVSFAAKHGSRLVARWVISTVPLVAPPARIASYPLAIVNSPQAARPNALQPSTRWTIRDLGPMQMNESYPMSLVEGQDRILYGGTYPGGRLFSYDLVKGVVEDLGSPSPPCNHLHDLVASPDGRVFGGLYRPDGRMFAYDPATRTTAEFGVPVPGAFSGSCRVMTWAYGRVYGVQRGHLFYLDTGTSQIVNKGSFFFQGARYLPSAIASDSRGNLLGTAGGRLFRYDPRNDAVLISKVEFEGWMFRDPDGMLCAFFPDGRLYQWEAERSRLVLSAQYPPVLRSDDPRHKDDPYGSMQVGMLSQGELIVARSGGVDPRQSKILVYKPGETQPVDLGNPHPGSRFLTAFTIGTSDVAYGLSTRVVYGLGRTPIRLYSVARSG